MCLEFSKQLLCEGCERLQGVTADVHPIYAGASTSLRPGLCIELICC